MATASLNNTPPEFFLANIHPADREAPGMLADAVDATTGELLSLERGFDPTDAAVLQAFMVERDTGTAVQGTGHKLREIKLNDGKLPGYVRSEVALILKRLIDAGDIRLEEVLIAQKDDFAGIEVHYFNLARRQKRVARLPTELR